MADQPEAVVPAKTVWPGSTQLGPVPAVLVGCAEPDGSKPNLITIAWTGIVCSQPPMLSISVRPERYSHGLISRSGVFTVNLTTVEMAAATDWCGVKSGRDFDKFAESKLTGLPGREINAPGVAESPVTLECRTTQVIKLGSHDLFLAEIVAVQVSSQLLDAEGRLSLEKAGLLAYAHGHYYALGRAIDHFGFSVRKKKSARRK
jgi:flavin reductase (DIM6/NTAB) family NADH-FMN oxidoreductase RutF